MSDVPISEPSDVIARAGAYYRNARYIVVAGTVAVGLWFAYDGWVSWPAQNARFHALTDAQQKGEYRPHPDFDIALQRELAVGLLALAPLMLGWFLYRSRGAYRLSGSTLHVPGHPQVPFEAMVEIDKSKWDRKGIAYVDYQLDEGAKVRRLALDDFVYEQKATDLIVQRIEAYLKPATPEGDGADADSGGDGSAEKSATSDTG